MKIKWIGSAFVCMTFAFACGGGDGGSGVDPNTLIVDLLPEESDQICTDLLSQPVDVREIDCAGTPVEVTEPDAADIADCADGLDSVGTDFPDCTATVGDFEDCQNDIINATDDEICDLVVDGIVPASCEAIFGDPDCAG